MPGSRHTRRFTHAAAAITLALSTLGASSALAQAASISVPGKCYVYWPQQGSQAIPIAIHALTPGAQVKVELQVDGTTVSGLPSLTADAAGSINTQLSNWTSGLSDGPTRAAASKVVVSDVASGTEVAEVAVDIANVGLDVDASRKVFGVKRRWIISGLEQLGGGQTYWAFYFKHSKMVGKQKIGSAAGACGYLRTRQPLIPFKRTGTFVFKVQASRTYDPDLAWIGGTIQQGKKK